MRKINPGVIVAAVGAVVLLISLFLNWYQPGLTAWTSFEVWDLVLAALAVATLVVVAADLGWWRGPLPTTRLLAIGLAALLIVVAALLNHPPVAIGRDVQSGAWIGLLGAALMAIGGILSEARVSLSLKVDRAGSHGPRATQHTPGEPETRVADLQPEPLDLTVDDGPDQTRAMPQPPQTLPPR